MPISKEFWSNRLIKKLFPSNSFTSQCIREDDLVNNGRVIHNSETDLPTATVGTITVPAAITQIDDNPLDYNCIPFRTSPSLIMNIEEVEVNYNKRESVLGRHSLVLNKLMADYVPYLWAPQGLQSHIVRTSGAARTSSAKGTTGKRKAFTKKDLLEIKMEMDANDVPFENRFVLLTVQMLGDLLSDPQMLSKDYVDTANLITGSVGRTFGFEIYVRSTTGTYANNALSPKSPIAVVDADDNAFALAWQKDMVLAAMGETKLFFNADVAELYGSVLSTESRLGGRSAYLDYTGVYAIVETAA